MQKSAWISAHLFHYGDLSVLLNECVKPIVDVCRAGNLIDSYFFIRYWQGGPHIRLRLLPTITTNEGEIQAILANYAEQFFTDHPSTETFDVQYYEKVESYLSRLEYGEERHMPLQPANSLLYIPYEPEYNHYGGIEAMPFVEKLFMRSSDVALRLLAHSMTRDQRTTQAVAMVILAVAQQNSQQLAAVFERDLYSWQRMLGNVKNTLYRGFALQYQRQQKQLRRLAERLLEGSDSRLQPGTPLADWRQAIGDTYQALQTLQQAGALQVSSPSWAFDPLPSIFLRCLHMNNNRLGIDMLNETFVYFLVKQTLYDLAGIKVPDEEMGFQTKEVVQ